MLSAGLLQSEFPRFGTRSYPCKSSSSLFKVSNRSVYRRPRSAAFHRVMFHSLRTAGMSCNEGKMCSWGPNRRVSQLGNRSHLGMVKHYLWRSSSFFDLLFLFHLGISERRVVTQVHPSIRDDSKKPVESTRIIRVVNASALLSRCRLDRPLQLRVVRAQRSRTQVVTRKRHNAGLVLIPGRETNVAPRRNPGMRTNPCSPRRTFASERSSAACRCAVGCLRSSDGLDCLSLGS